MTKAGDRVSAVRARSWPWGNAAKSFPAKGLPRRAMAVAIGLAVIAPLFVEQRYIVHMAVMSAIYAVLTMSQNLVTGTAGQLSMGQVAFYGIGAYTSALLAISMKLPFYVTFLVGATVAAFFGLLIALPTIRLGGIYLGMVTLGFAEIVRMVFLNWVTLTRGPNGLPGIPRPVLLGYRLTTPHAYYVMIVGLVVLTYVVYKRIMASRTGLALMAMREDELAASSMGVDVAKYRIFVFVVASFFTGLMGAFYAHFITFISPTSFASGESFLILSMYVLGGPANMEGSILAAIFLSLAPEFLRSTAEYRMVLYGVLLMGLIIFKPEGITGLFKWRKAAGPEQMAAVKTAGDRRA
jgi:branched-chain amino acid transport system permease protein